MSKKEHVIIFKNDAVGDLTQSLPAIQNILKNNPHKDVIIYLSERSENFSFLINGKNINFQKLNYDLSFFEKIKIIFLIRKLNVSKIFILTPKSFYFILPIFFRNIKFYGLCLDGPENYKRPSSFFRKFLYKKVINDRSAIFKRKSTIDIQKELTNENQIHLDEFDLIPKLKKSDLLKKFLPKKYLYFHIKKKTFDKLGWGVVELKILFNEFLNYYDHIIFTKDIEKNCATDIFKNEFSSLNGNFIQKKDKIILFDHVKGQDLYNTIKYSSKIVAFHGMMTNLGSLEKKSVLDLWYCKIENWNDYRSYRNAFYEFKPKYLNYDFTIPSKNIRKTISKIKFSIKKNVRNEQ